MAEVAARPRVALSEWQGHCWLTPDGPPPVRPGQSVRLGALSLRETDQNVTSASFGNPTNPSATIFDGYLFDRGALAAELGFGAQVPPDAELAAAGYARWGTEVFRRLEGGYLLAIWDGTARRFLLGHDGLGRHPVFYAADKTGLWFASNVLALARNPCLPLRQNRSAVARGLVMFWPEAGDTYFEGIHRVRPGYFLEVTGSGARREVRYWDPFPDDDEPWLPDDQVRDEFEPALARAVQRCLALGPNGILLSGGVDSVTIAALAAQDLRARQAPSLVAVCGQSGHEKSYEEEMQALVARALSMPLDVSTTVESQGGLSDVDRSLAIVGNLPAPTHLYWVGSYTAFYRRAASRGLNVLLTGSGGDNWLGVAERHAADLLGSGRLAEFSRFVRADVRTAGASWRGSLRRLGWTDGLRPHLEVLWAKAAPDHKRAYHRRQWPGRLPAWLCPDPRDREALIDQLAAMRTPALTDRGRAPRSQYRHYFKYLQNPYLHFENETAFHIESWTGLRLLSPYHDRTVVSMFNRISPALLLHGTRYKGLLRPLVSKYLPGLGLENQRKYYAPEHSARHLAELRAGVAAAAHEQPLRLLSASGLIDPVRAADDFRALDAKPLPAVCGLFALLCHEHWLHAHPARAAASADPI